MAVVGVTRCIGAPVLDILCYVTAVKSFAPHHLLKDGWKDSIARRYLREARIFVDIQVFIARRTQHQQGHEKYYSYFFHFKNFLYLKNRI